MAGEETTMATVFLDVKRVVEAVLRRLDAEQVRGTRRKTPKECNNLVVIPLANSGSPLIIIIMVTFTFYRSKWRQLHRY